MGEAKCLLQVNHNILLLTQQTGILTGATEKNLCLKRRVGSCEVAFTHHSRRQRIKEGSALFWNKYSQGAGAGFLPSLLERENLETSFSSEERFLAFDKNLEPSTIDLKAFIKHTVKVFLKISASS